MNLLNDGRHFYVLEKHHSIVFYAVLKKKSRHDTLMAFKTDDFSSKQVFCFSNNSNFNTSVKQNIYPD